MYGYSKTVAGQRIVAYRETCTRTFEFPVVRPYQTVRVPRPLLLQGVHIIMQPFSSGRVASRGFHRAPGEHSSDIAFRLCSNLFQLVLIVARRTRSLDLYPEPPGRYLLGHEPRTNKRAFVCRHDRLEQTMATQRSIASPFPLLIND